MSTARANRLQALRSIPVGAGRMESQHAIRPRSEASPPRPQKYSHQRVTHDGAQARSESSFELSRLIDERNPIRRSRPPSYTGGDHSGRSRLWHELREVQRKSRPPTNYSRSPSREPP